MNKVHVTLLIGILMGLTLLGCEKKGPAEEFGEMVDEEVEQAQETIDEDGPMENMGEDMDEAFQEDQEEEYEE